MTDLGGLGYGVSLGFGINATGEAVGRSYLVQTVPTTGCPPRHTCVAHPADPFSWIAGSMTDLGTLGGTFSEARAVNRNGDIVGGSNSDAFLAQAQQDARPRDYLCGRSRRCGAGRAAWLRARRVVRERAGRSLGTYRRSGIDGYAGQVCDTVARLTGQPARSLDDLLQEVAPELKAGSIPVSVMIQGGSSSTPGHPPAFTPPHLLAGQAQ